MIYSRFKFKKNRTMKAIIIYVSTYQSNTLKVAQRMANELSAFLATTREAENIDLSDFSRAGYIMPGRYEFVVRVNNNELPELYNISYVVPANDPKGSEACLPPELIHQIGLKPEWAEKLSLATNEERLEAEQTKYVTYIA